MMLIDTGPFVALFDPADGEHRRCRTVLEHRNVPLLTTLPVLTEAFHLLRPGSRGAVNLGLFIRRGGVRIWFMDDESLRRAQDLMDQYADHPMDLADASLVTAAETLDTRRIFTLDRGDFSAYRIRRGLSLHSFDILPEPS